jgi:hypothetical protein
MSSQASVRGSTVGTLASMRKEHSTSLAGRPHFVVSDLREGPAHSRGSTRHQSTGPASLNPILR